MLNGRSESYRMVHSSSFSSRYAAAAAYELKLFISKNRFESGLRFTHTLHFGISFFISFISFFCCAAKKPRYPKLITACALRRPVTMRELNWPTRLAHLTSTRARHTTHLPKSTCAYAII